MNCDEYLPLISGHLDGMNSQIEERRLQEHLRSCESCRALLAQMEQNDALLKRSAVTPPAGLSERIMEQVRREKQAPRKKRWIPLAVSGAAAAAMLSLVVFGSLPMWGGAGSADTAAAEAIDQSKLAVTGAAAEPQEGAFEGTDAAILPPEDTENDMSFSGSPVETYTVTGTDELLQSVQGSGFIPNFPMYGSYGTPAEPTESSKRSAAAYRATAPMLIVWDAETVDALADRTPEDLNEYAPLNAKLAPSLYARCQAMLPLLRELDVISPAEGFGVTVYSVPYETMMEVFDECVGVYENAIYYPAQITSPDACTIVLIHVNHE